jgi:hypothetical protein
MLRQRNNLRIPQLRQNLHQTQRLQLPHNETPQTAQNQTTVLHLLQALKVNDGGGFQGAQQEVREKRADEC